MTVSSQTSRVDYAGDGVTAIFPVPFYFLEQSHLKVILSDDATGAETVLVLNTDYTVTGAGVPAGGSITVPSEPAVGFTLTILRSVPITQETDYVPNDPFPAESHERALDKLTMLLQQGAGELGRAIRVPESDPEPNRLPSLASRALKLMGFDSGGNPIAVPPGAGSAEELALILADAVNPLNGSARIGHEGSTVREALLATAAADAAAAAAISVLETDVQSARYDIDNLLASGTKSFDSVNGNIVSGGFAPIRCVNILGDSISYGANAQDIQRDSWVGILGKMLNIEFGTQNLGWLNVIASTSNGEGTYFNYHTQTGQTGTWVSITNAAAGHIPSGYAIESSVATSTLVYRVPTSQRYLRVWYDGTVTGTIEILINAVVVQTLVTTGVGTGYERGAALELATLAATQNGLCTFTVRCAAGTVRITGFEFANDTAGEYRLMNFSRDGRAGRYVTQDVINRACAGCYFMVWALGTNDVPGGASAITEYTQRIDWLIAAAAANKTRVVLLDVMYDQLPTHGLREQLRRANREIPGSVLIEAAKTWAVDGVELDSSERTARGLSAGVHPEEIGHRLIAETVAHRIGLSVTSKRIAIRRDPTWNALDLSASGLFNSSAVPGSFTGWRIGEKAIELVVNITTVPVGTVTLGTIPSTLLPSGAFTSINVRSNPDLSGNSGLFTIASNGVIQYRPAGTAPTSVALNTSVQFNDTAVWH